MKFELNTSKFAFLLALPVFVYINARAYLLAFTYDECWTYLGYATDDFWKVVTNEFPAANNHVLHSLAMGLVDSFFGQYEYALRLPVLFSFIVLAVFVYKIAIRLSAKMWWLPFILIIYQPYLLDYFVAARGYGMALAFMFGSIYYLYLFAEQEQSQWMLLSLIFAALASYSNFTYLLVFIAVALAVLVLSIRKNSALKGSISIGIIGLLLLGAVYKPISQLIEAKELYYGGNIGFFEDTLSTLSRSFIYSTSESIILAVFFAFIMAASGVLGLAKFFSKAKLDLGFWLTFLLIVLEVGTILQHHVMGSPYLINRTAIFFIPLILFSFSWLIDQLRDGLLRNILAFGFVFMSVINLLSALNISYLLDFKEYADVQTAMKMVRDDERIPKADFAIGKSIYLNAPINFYRVKYGLERIAQSGLEYCEETDQTKYYYLFEKDIECVASKETELIYAFPVSHTYLYRVP
jgi:hypothetical protein